MYSYEQRLNKLIDLTNTMESMTYLRNELKLLKEEIEQTYIDILDNNFYNVRLDGTIETFEQYSKRIKQLKKDNEINDIK